MIEPTETLSKYITTDSQGRRIEVTLTQDGKSLPRNTIEYLESSKVKTPNKGDYFDRYA